MLSVYLMSKLSALRQAPDARLPVGGIERIK